MPAKKGSKSGKPPPPKRSKPGDIRKYAKKKDTIKGKQGKKNLAKARRSFEEMKKYNHEQLAIDMGVTAMVTSVDNVTNPTVLKPMVQSDVAQTASTAKILPMWSFYNPKQGFDEQSMIGTKRLNKYLQCKMVFNFPEHAQLDNPRYYIIQLWVTKPFGATNFTTPNVGDVTRAQFLTHITNHVSQFFDEAGKREFVNFNPIETKDFKILSYRRVKPNKDGQEISPAMAIEPGVTEFPETFGKASQVNLSFKWKLKQAKNTRYSTGTSLAGPIDFMYPNDSWIPALIYYSPDAGNSSAGQAAREGTENAPFIYYNDQTWFTG